MPETLVQIGLWLAVFALLGAAFWAIAKESSARTRRTVEQFERDVEQSRGSLLQAAAGGLQKVLSDEKRAAIEYKQDERSGTTRTGSRGDDEDRTAPKD